MEPDCSGLGFTEIEECKIIDDPKFGRIILATGWTQSTGSDGAWPYVPPEGWHFHPDYPEVTDSATGTHGGCPSCIMTKITLYKQLEESELPVESKKPSTLMIAVAVVSIIIILYMLLRKR